MSKYIDTDRLREMIAKYQTTAEKAYNPNNEDADFWHGKVVACEDILHIFDSLQQEQPDEQPEYGYLFEDGSTSDEESLVEGGAYKKN